MVYMRYMEIQCDNTDIAYKHHKWSHVASPNCNDEHAWKNTNLTT